MYSNMCSKPYNKPELVKKEEPVKHCLEPVKMLQVPVIKGFGEKEELVVSRLIIAPPNPPIFRIVAIDKEVTITDFKLASVCDNRDGETWKSKVIIDGFIDKNILYKTISEFTPEAVGGPVFQFTTRINFATFVEVISKEPIYLTDHVEILSAFVEGEKEELLDPNHVAVGAPDFAVTFNSILEKMIVKITLKITRTEHVSVK
ncbi:MAG TPA: SPOCS domain-containing protein [Clostridium sp.]|uniref:SPOCS domain-containing protein n=1 Tax=Clostridium sp. TaxID=1506 RepID=UPI002F91E6D3